MIISYLWLKELVNHTLTPEELAEALTCLGLETTITDDKRGAFNKFIIGKVESVEPHPDADNLNITLVDAGGDPIPIVCAAPNVRAGQVVPVALPGAKIPDGPKIEKKKIRGEISEGMICSEAELGLGEDAAGIMVLDDSCKPGTELAECLELEDVMLEVDLTPNRGDCLGLIGIAREVAAATGAELLWGLGDDTGRVNDEPALENLEVRIDNPGNCPRYTARGISGVTVAPSPFKIRRRLAASGVRPVNNIVDATNYVMMETGHPLHCFDMRMIDGEKIISRSAAKGEKFTALDGREHTLSDWMPVIADAEKVVALAGVMGGKNSEVSGDTKNVILEAAYFNPKAVRKTAKKLGISTESSHRFERGVNPETVDSASLRAARLIAETAGGVVKGFADVYPRKVEFPKITLRTEKVNKTVGLELTDEKIADCLSRLSFDFKHESQGFFSVACPPYRHDMDQEIDLVEEVARLVGYKNIPSTTARIAQHESSPEINFIHRGKLNSLWAASGFTETINYSFINSDWRKNLTGGAEENTAVVTNPINADWEELRGSLLPGLLNAAAYNLRQGEEKISTFETGVVFKRSGISEIEERFLSAGVMTGGEEELFNVTIPRDFHRLKGIVSNVIKTAAGKTPVMARPARTRTKSFLYTHRQVDITLDGNVLGFLGRLHPVTAESFGIDREIYCFEISVDGLLKSRVGTVRAKSLPRFPGIKRDLALIVDENVEVGGIVETILETDPKRIRTCSLFDLYRGEQIPEGKKSMAFRLFFQDEQKTLTDAAGDKVVENILDRVREKYNAGLR